MRLITPHVKCRRIDLNQIARDSLQAVAVFAAAGTIEPDQGAAHPAKISN
jgi:hypothetical protein